MARLGDVWLRHHKERRDLGVHGRMRHQIARWLFTDRPWWQSYLVAVVATVLVANMWGLLANPVLPLSLTLLFAVAISAFVGGVWPGLISTAVSTFLANPLLVKLNPPAGDAGSYLPSMSWAIPFVLASAFISVLLDALRRFGQRSVASQHLYVSTLANISDAIVTTDPQGRIEYMNRAAVGLLKLDLDAVAGQLFEDVIDVRDVATGGKSASLSNRVLAASATIHSSTRQVLYCPDGRQVPIEAAASPVRDPSGELRNVVITIHDCSEQRQIERALQERLALQERFEYIASVVPGAVHEFRILPDQRRQLSYASHSFKEIFGFDPETFRQDAAGLRAMIHRDDADRVYGTWAAATRNLKPIDIEYRVVTPHRGTRWVALSAVPSREVDGSTLWHGVYMDVTERKRADERLRASQLQLHAALEAGDMGVLMVDLDSGVVEMDANARRLWNLQSVADPVLTLGHLLATIHPDNVSAVKEQFRQMAGALQMPGNAQKQSSEYRLAIAGAEDRWLLCRGRIYMDDTTGRKILVGVIIDTTRHRHQEEQRLHSQKLEALGVLAGGIAHDFNNLLLAISGNAKLLLEDLPTADPVRTSVEEIDKAAGRAADLVRRILSFSSLTDPNSEPRATALPPVLAEVLGLARAIFPASVSIQSVIPDELPAVAADSSQIHQALINLLTNAADAAAQADNVVRLIVDVVAIGVADFDDAPALRPGSYVRIAVSDRGRGIERDIRQRIFDPFFTTKPTGKGTGLGLATVHGIMKSVEGAVILDSEPGRGSTFFLYFPVQHQLPVIDEPKSTDRSERRKAHILYVDDEESLIFLMTRTLQRMGHRVTAYAAPEQALAALKANADDFDLVVSDMAMPGMSGLELAKQALAIRPELPFVITSGYMDAATMAMAEDVGVRQMIMKPNTVDELSELLNSILQKENGVSE